MSKKNLAAIAAFILTFSTLTAQVKKDTVVLSVYNTDKKYLLTQATFSPKVDKKGLLGDMVMAFDTAHSLENVAANKIAPATALPAHLSAKAPAATTVKQLKITHTGKFKNAPVKGRVALINYNPNVDATAMCLDLQRAGAIAVIFRHYSNNRDSIILTKGIYKDSIKIPCYTLRSQRGFEVAQMLPSHVGIKKVDSLGSALTLQQVPTINADSIAKANKGKDTALFSIFPNPTDDDAYLQYSFTTPTDVTIELNSESGQILNHTVLEKATSGTFNLPTDGLANGVYIVHLQYGKFQRNEKILVER